MYSRLIAVFQEIENYLKIRVFSIEQPFTMEKPNHRAMVHYSANV